MEHWYEFLLKKTFPVDERSTPWYLQAQTHLSPAYLKELFLYSELQDISLQEAWLSMNNRKKLIKSGFTSKSADGLGFTG